ncbi:MAG: sulfotransferase domain-containing protein [Anaerolineae bacterium]|nr:sulfotransferase domain-containing protein [Anaerolineae bacterium]
MTQPITIVSGLPRSGTSMMMKMLQAGGMPILTDQVRQADEDNPKGYYELERVKQIQDDQAWLQAAQGQAVKVISALLPKLPSSYTYKVIFMHRVMQEILDSQRQMLVRRGEPTDKVSDEKLAAAFEKHLKSVHQWLVQQPNIDVLYVNYNSILKAPLQHAREIDAFLGLGLDTVQMAQAVDQSLYRQRH